jgi:hypothetical protein
VFVLFVLGEQNEHLFIVRSLAGLVRDLPLVSSSRLVILIAGGRVEESNGAVEEIMMENLPQRLLRSW